MDRNAKALLIALLCVLAVALAAATLANPQHPTGSGDGAGGPGNVGGGLDRNDGTTDGNGMDNPTVDRTSGSSPLQTACVPLFQSPAFLLGMALVIAAIGAYAYRRDGLVPAIAVLFVLSTVLFPAWLMVTACGSDDPGAGGSIIPPLKTGPAPNGTEGGGGGAQPAISPAVVVAGLLVVGLVLAVLVYTMSGDDAPPEDEGPPPDAPQEPAQEETLAAIGDAAGEAADRIDEAADVENEVFRAWREMTTHLDVPNQKASTPGEFAAAAREAGMDADHVDTLTDLFREVRYGGEEPTPEREERAVRALRAIEDTYGGER